LTQVKLLKVKETHSEAEMGDKLTISLLQEIRGLLSVAIDSRLLTPAALLRAKKVSQPSQQPHALLPL
jgi:hypothetical protein